MKKNYFRSTSIAFLAVSLLSLLNACDKSASPPPAASPPTNASHNAHLNDLGVITNLGSPKGPDGKDLDVQYNPLSRRTRTLAPLSELYFASAAPTTSLNGIGQGLLDDISAGKPLTMLFSETDPTLNTYWKTVAAGDLDGDGLDEVVIVYAPTQNSVYLRVLGAKAGGGFAYRGAPKEIITGVTVILRLTIAMGDFDGDGKAEIAVATGRDLFLFDDTLEQMAHRSFLTKPTAHQQGINLTKAELDGDDKDELVVVDWTWFLPSSPQTGSTGNAQYFVYKGLSLATPMADGYVHGIKIGDSTLISLVQAAVSAGDLDGDRLDEIAFTGIATGNGEYPATIVISNARAPTPFEVVDVYAHNEMEGFQGVNAMLDIDGDGVKELIASSLLFEDFRSKKFQRIGVIPLGSATAVGDFNGDHREDIATYAHTPDRPDRIIITGYNEANQIATLSTMNPGMVSYFAALAAPNVDNDSVILKYTGQRELLFSDPVVIAALAAPPYWEGVGQNIDGSSTTFGTSTGTSVDSERSLGFTVGASVGYEWDTPILGCTAACAELKATVEVAIDWLLTKSTSITNSYATSTGAGEDKVLFAAVPFDVYYYTIVAAPDEGAIGKPLTINVPRQPQTFSVSRTFYNEKNGSAPDVDERVFSHTIGKPRTYPTLAAIEGLLASRDSKDGYYKSSKSRTVGEGAGSQTLAIDVDNAQGTGKAFGLNVGVESSITAGSILVGLSVGFQYGFSYTTTTTESTLLSGTVGDLPTSAFTTENIYSFGLAGYPQLVNGKDAIVVNYWVE